MKSDNNSVQDALTYIRKQVAEQLETAEINFSFDFPDHIPAIKLNSEQKRNLLLISKEIIHNIIKHAHATKVIVTAQVNSSSLQLKIADNGKGFDPAKTRQFGNGLKNINRRAQEINGQLNIYNHAGTTIDLTLTFG
jgi:signal transduction histidine kinase